MLKCPICGREYSYEKKICQECEDYSIKSGLIESQEKTSRPWNCAMFLPETSSTFRSKKFSRHTFQITPEPRNINVGEIKKYEWNTYTSTKFKRCIEKSLTESNLAYDSVLIKDILKVVERKAKSSLIYE